MEKRAVVETELEKEAAAKVANRCKKFTDDDKAEAQKAVEDNATKGKK